jgi:hypothetical protein
MNEELMHRVMMIAAMTVTICAALGAVTLLVLTATEGMRLLLPCLFLIAVTAGAGWATTYYGHRTTGVKRVFPNEVEREVLTWRQRRELRGARGGLVMQRALVDIENERDNIIHRQIEAAEDPDKPPHPTVLSPHPVEDEIRRRLVADEDMDVATWDGTQWR